jgi:hypothetical protein
MKTLKLAATTLLFTSIAQAQTLTASQAKDHEGQKATVCGTVASEHTSTRAYGQPTFINLDAPYPNQLFTILVWGDDRANIGSLPSTGSRVCATGFIKDYRGTPEMVVNSGEQLSK